MTDGEDGLSVSMRFGRGDSVVLETAVEPANGTPLQGERKRRRREGRERGRGRTKPRRRGQRRRDELRGERETGREREEGKRDVPSLPQLEDR